MPFQPSHLLVTGGAGFIGSNFIRHYMQHYPKCQITNLDTLTYAGFLSNCEDLNQFDNYQFIKGDICDSAAVTRLLRQQPIDTIVHFAAESHVDRSIKAPAAFIQTNIVGTFTLLEAARVVWQHERDWQPNQCRFHQVSTDEVFGTLKVDDPAFTENTPYSPNSPYSATKAGADHLVHAYFHTYGLPITISNCSNNYGPYQHAEKFIPTIIQQCMQQMAIPVYGDGSNIRDWLYVDDHCQGVIDVIHQGNLGETYNIGASLEMSNLDVAKHICQVFDEQKPEHAPHEKLIENVTDRPGHDWRYAMNAGKIHEELQWQPSVSFSEGIKKTIAFYEGLLT